MDSNAGSGFPSPGPLLAAIDGPPDLRTLPIDQLPEVCQELRTYIWETITRIGGHLAPSLGVVELTVVLHYLFDTPNDKIVWDVGHQAYVHKVLTGRRDQLRTIKQYQGISGFLKRNESAYDTFGAGHASTAISAALGMAAARDLKGQTHRVVAVVGDGGMTGGLAYEGLNNAGASGRDVIVILNDNAMSISPNVGAISNYLTRIISHPLFNRAKSDIWGLTEKLPKTDAVRNVVRKVEESLKTLLTPGMLFEDLGFRYLGPIDGHDIRELISVLEKVREMDGPILVHVLTKKGKGYQMAEIDPQKYHGVKPMPGSVKVPAGKVEEKPRPSYTEVFADSMVRLARKDPKVVAITAAMADGTGLMRYAAEFPDRFCDVGIAEAHGITFAAGLATEGMRPVAAIYSTFLQRAYDQIVHDVALQHLPVVFALDRAGLVGEDGPTHHGTLDLSYLGCIPGMVVAAPRNATELYGLLQSAVTWDGGPFAVRYPRDTVPESEFPENAPPIAVGSWEILSAPAEVTLLAVGSMVAPAEEAAQILSRRGINCGVINARFVRPLDARILEVAARQSRLLVTLEENVLRGGFGSQIDVWLEEHGLRSAVELLRIGLPDEFVEHGPRKKLLELCGLSAPQIAERISQRIATHGPNPTAAGADSPRDGARSSPPAPSGRAGL
ncbi:MAG: 1-deoxy-D-xylulose-5-phosphate synthase [Candidatus Eisenbacteria bacterium]|nr:1-deoxy-D-xylulose-5-phosphate synthase [Candidatus Eisenbacteria bacterium]